LGISQSLEQVYLTRALILRDSIDVTDGVNLTVVTVDVAYDATGALVGVAAAPTEVRGRDARDSACRRLRRQDLETFDGPGARRGCIGRRTRVADLASICADEL
jgi:hypothetical protein